MRGKGDIERVRLSSGIVVFCCWFNEVVFPEVVARHRSNGSTESGAVLRVAIFASTGPSV